MEIERWTEPSPGRRVSTAPRPKGRAETTWKCGILHGHQTARNREDRRLVVAVYNTRSQTDRAITELAQAGCDLRKLSLIGRDYHGVPDGVHYYKVGDRVNYQGRFGASWGGLQRISIEAVVLWGQDFGHLLVAGWLVGRIASTLENAKVAQGFNAIGLALRGLDIPQNSVVRYGTAIKSCRYVLIASGTEAQVVEAKAIIDQTDASDIEAHRVCGHEEPDFTGGQHGTVITNGWPCLSSARSALKRAESATLQSTSPG